MIKNVLVLLLLISVNLNGWSQEVVEKDTLKLHPFIAYEIGEAVFNEFKSISGEVGIRFRNNRMLRIAHMNVTLSEEHLSSSFAGAVDGPNVEGSFFGFEAFYDFPVLWKTLYLAPSIGYYKSKYNHTILEERLKNNTPTIGMGISYRETHLFGVKGLYFTFSFPLRLSLNPIEEVQLGTTTIVNSTFDNNIWLFIGYEF